MALLCRLTNRSGLAALEMRHRSPRDTSPPSGRVSTTSTPWRSRWALMRFAMSRANSCSKYVPSGLLLTLLLALCPASRQTFFFVSTLVSSFFSLVSSQKHRSVGTLRLLTILLAGNTPCVLPPPSSIRPSTHPRDSSLSCSCSLVRIILSHQISTLPSLSQPTAVRSAGRATSGVRFRFSFAPFFKRGTPERKLPPRSVSICGAPSAPTEIPQS